MITKKLPRSTTHLNLLLSGGAYKTSFQRVSSEGQPVQLDGVIKLTIYENLDLQTPIETIDGAGTSEAGNSIMLGGNDTTINLVLSKGFLLSKNLLAYKIELTNGDAYALIASGWIVPAGKEIPVSQPYIVAREGLGDSYGTTLAEIQQKQEQIIIRYGGATTPGTFEGEVFLVNLGNEAYTTDDGEARVVQKIISVISSEGGDVPTNLASVINKYIGASGSFVVSRDNATNIKGEKGFTGANGAPGTNGYTPSLTLEAITREGVEGFIVYVTLTGGTGTPPYANGYETDSPGVTTLNKDDARLIPVPSAENGRSYHFENAFDPTDDGDVVARVQAVIDVEDASRSIPPELSALIGMYYGRNGLTSDISQATNIRGADGLAGGDGRSYHLVRANVPDGDSRVVVVVSSAFDVEDSSREVPSSILAFVGKYYGASGLVDDIADATNIKGENGSDVDGRSYVYILGLRNFQGGIYQRVISAFDVVDPSRSVPSSISNYYGYFLGLTGYVSSIADATDIGGSDGQNGISTAYTYSVETDGDRQVLRVASAFNTSDTSTAIPQKVLDNVGKYVGATGFVDNIADAGNIKGTKGDPGDKGDPGEDSTSYPNDSGQTPNNLSFEEDGKLPRHTIDIISNVINNDDPATQTFTTGSIISLHDADKHSRVFFDDHHYKLYSIVSQIPKHESTPLGSLFLDAGEKLTAGGELFYVGYNNTGDTPIGSIERLTGTLSGLSTSLFFAVFYFGSAQELHINSKINLAGRLFKFTTPERSDVEIVMPVGTKAEGEDVYLYIIVLEGDNRDLLINGSRTQVQEIEIIENTITILGRTPIENPTTMTSVHMTSNTSDNLASEQGKSGSVSVVERDVLDVATVDQALPYNTLSQTGTYTLIIDGGLQVDISKLDTLLRVGADDVDGVLLPQVTIKVLSVGRNQQVVSMELIINQLGEQNNLGKEGGRLKNPLAFIGGRNIRLGKILGVGFATNIRPRVEVALPAKIVRLEGIRISRSLATHSLDDADLVPAHAINHIVFHFYETVAKMEHTLYFTETFSSMDTPIELGRVLIVRFFSNNSAPEMINGFTTSTDGGSGFAPTNVNIDIVFNLKGYV